VAVALADSEVAVMVAVPLAPEVTVPAEEIVATDELEVVHITVAPTIVLPPASFTVGTNVAVSPTGVIIRLVGESVIEDAT